ncbi:hypothetical protein Fmac_004358 [Flemingia macrophylla]|uniref:Uncharacterized protein n=1 Tax=Flemingia macrophylla TaxID=520843 RepID=A0ABD1N4X9_9FABA
MSPPSAAPARKAVASAALPPPLMAFSVFVKKATTLVWTAPVSARLTRTTSPTTTPLTFPLPLGMYGGLLWLVSLSA